MPAAGIGHSEAGVQGLDISTSAGDVEMMDASEDPNVMDVDSTAPGVAQFANIPSATQSSLPALACTRDDEGPGSRTDRDATGL